MNEGMALYLERLDRPEDWFPCRVCGGRHRRGIWSRAEHRLLAICARFDALPEPPGFVLTPPDLVAAIAAEPGIDGETGLIVHCNHPEGDRPCFWDELKRLVPDAQRSTWWRYQEGTA